MFRMTNVEIAEHMSQSLDLRGKSVVSADDEDDDDNLDDEAYSHVVGDDDGSVPFMTLQRISAHGGLLRRQTLC